MKKDIESRADIQILVDHFYDQVRQDSLIGPLFTEVARVDWAHHLPKLYDFWEDLLFGTDHYRGRPFPPHTKLNLEKIHFERWLQFFLQTVDHHFTGPKAAEAKERALRIAQNFMINLRILHLG